MKKQYRQQQTLMLLFLNDHNYSFDDLKQKIKTTRDLELVKALFAVLNNGIRTFDKCKSQKDRMNLWQNCRYISMVLSVDMDFKPDTVRRYFDYTKKNLDKNILSLEDSEYSTYHFLIELKEIILDMERVYIDERLVELCIRYNEIKASQNIQPSKGFQRKRRIKQIRTSKLKLIREYGNICMLGDEILDNRTITYHHIKALRENGNHKPINGALLSFRMHQLLHKIEQEYPKLAKEIAYYLKYYKDTRDEERRLDIRTKLEAYETELVYSL